MAVLDSANPKAATTAMGVDTPQAQASAKIPAAQPAIWALGVVCLHLDMAVPNFGIQS